MTQVVTGVTGRTAGRALAAVRTSSFALYSGIGLVYALFRFGSYTYMPDRVTDTPTYEHVAHLALWNWRFYVGER
ncbi:MAG: hypothetical protein ACRDNM_15985, partial [Gaiellaceae bacterium]